MRGQLILQVATLCTEQLSLRILQPKVLHKRSIRFVLLILGREWLRCQHKSPFALSIKGGHGANTIILSGLLAINLPFVVCSFCPPSRGSAVALIEVRCLISASAQPHLLKVFVLCGVLGWLLGAPVLGESWCWSTSAFGDCKNKRCRDKSSQACKPIWSSYLWIARCHFSMAGILLET